MPTRNEQPVRGRNRVSNACQRCRKHKIKCSGMVPCQTCENRGLHCEFDANDRKVVISESALRDLRSKVSELERRQSQTQSWPRQSAPSQLNQNQEPGLFQPVDETATSYDTSYINDTSVQPISQSAQQPYEKDDEPSEGLSSREDSAAAVPTALSNPLVSEQPNYVADSSGKVKYLGHSSTWSFTQQLLRMTHQSPHVSPTSELTVNMEGSVYHIDATQLNLTAEDVTGLPSLELSLFYVQSVKFRMSPLYYLLDEDIFVPNLHRFYECGTAETQELRLWYVHYLLIMALGKAFNAPKLCCTAGSKLFSRALRLQPDITFLCNDPLQSVEIFCCIALYLQSVDHRASAHVYIGQALRLAQAHGMHTDMQASSFGTKFVDRSRRVWWTVYTLDRRFGAAFGVPFGLHDEDVTTPYPSKADTNSTAAVGQAIHVKICQLLGRVISTVYSHEGALKKSYLTTAQEVLRGIGGLAEELAQFSERCIGEISRVAAHLNLAYHQCIMLASRPFLFHLLRTRLASQNPARNFHLSTSMKGLIQVCIDSAVQAATTLSRLKEHELLDSFAPFDLESANSAALVLALGSGVHPRLLPREDWLEICYSCFDHMSSKGNALAGLRKSEVEQLAQICQRFRSNRVRQALGPTANSNVGTTMVTHQVSPAATSVQDYASLPSLGDPFFDEWIADDGFSGAQIMDLADALTTQDFVF